MSFLHNLNTKQCIFVDNAAFHLYENLDNGVPVIPYRGEIDDNELLKLLQFLKEIKNTRDYTVTTAK